MSDLDTTSAGSVQACGCCDDGSQPPELYNPPGQTALNYRISLHSQFLERMLGQISRIELPDGAYQGSRPLSALTARTEDDFSIGLLDCAAVVGDVLTFYQERIANEAYLRTATERFSILQLARAIGYELRAGVAAETYLAFLLDESGSTPQSAVISAGTQVQSLPQKQDEVPQTFETASDFTAHVAWNALYPRQNEPQNIKSSTKTVFFEGINTGLEKGDLLLFEKGTAVRARVVIEVQKETAGNRTKVTLQASVGLNDPDTVYAMREKVSPFGYNATHSDMVAVPENGTNPFVDWDGCGGKNSSDDDCGWEIWKSSLSGAGYFEDADLYLERVVEGILPDSWIMLNLAPDIYVMYRVREVQTASLTEFNISGKSTGLSLNTISGSSLQDNETDKPCIFKMRKTTIFTSSEALALAEVPVTSDIAAGDLSVIVKNTIDDLPQDHKLIISGEDADGRKVSELVVLESTTPVNGSTDLRFTAELNNSYRLETAVLHGNVVRATHGETVADEALGGGDGATPHQMFLLKKPPLTHVAAETPSGSKAELTVRVNGVAWEQVNTLYGLAPDAKSYIVRLDDDANARIIFGDGKLGARLPTGQENVRATYRSGIGLAGEVGSGTLSLLKKRPFGVSSVSNPIEADGGADPETFASAQVNAPLTVKTLDRIVSLQDYEDFARAFSGIGKASAVALWSGTQELVHVTIADTTGGAVPDDQVDKLRTEMEAARDLARVLCIGGFETLIFNVEAGVLVSGAYVRKDVETAITAALSAAYAFPQRTFGQPVSSAEIIAAIQDIDGVIAVDLDALYVDGAAVERNSLLTARRAQYSETAASTLCGAVLPAELLLINPAGIKLKEMAP